MSAEVHVAAEGAVVKTHVLVVDDEPDLEALVQQRFRKGIKSGAYSFVFARNGLEALRALGAHPEVEVVLTDLNMPGMSGLELLAKVRSVYTELPVVMISAYGDAETQQRARDLGARDFVSKPIDFERIREHVLGDAP